ncbi:hypothetical protein EDEG_03802 [Edhazardia aedis USNM 41457]|uniref:Uncharacterized protein n=1 Tax=Edhazardia aedis (strain USNM 41457) TaxID=1003232 RepID=J8ZPP5_EDHAE|nr:hypothetical protein EDEG_03802 [Edhazardia aedis USNM 41457]|eukprot:EJW01658.1 hypothetical protein EDEG_03802 [Edhazardia aedis USNM 41457]
MNYKKLFFVFFDFVYISKMFFPQKNNSILNSIIDIDVIYFLCINTIFFYIKFRGNIYISLVQQFKSLNKAVYYMDDLFLFYYGYKNTLKRIHRTSIYFLNINHL